MRYVHFTEFIMNATTKHAPISPEAASDYVLTSYILTDYMVTSNSSFCSFHQPIKGRNPTVRRLKMTKQSQSILMSHLISNACFQL